VTAWILTLPAAISSQLLSPFEQAEGAYGGSPENRTRIVRSIIQEIKKTPGKGLSRMCHYQASRTGDRRVEGRLFLLRTALIPPNCSQQPGDAFQVSLNGWAIM